MMDGRMGEWLSEWAIIKVRWIDVHMDGWMLTGWVEGRMDKWVGEYTVDRYVGMYVCTYVCSWGRWMGR